MQVAVFNLDFSLSNIYNFFIDNFTFTFAVISSFKLNWIVVIFRMPARFSFLLIMIVRTATTSLMLTEMWCWTFTRRSHRCHLATIIPNCWMYLTMNTTLKVSTNILHPNLKPITTDNVYSFDKSTGARRISRRRLAQTIAVHFNGSGSERIDQHYDHDVRLMLKWKCL